MHMTLTNNIKVLVIDDEELIRWSLQTALKGLDLSVDVAESGEEALKRMEKNTYDIIITDLKMPGLDGLELLEVIRASGIKSIVILISAYLSHSTIKQASEYGAFKCVNKPFGMEDFLGVVKDAVYHREVTL